MKAKFILLSVMFMLLIGCSKTENNEIQTTEDGTCTPFYETDTISMLNKYEFDYTNEQYLTVPNHINQSDSNYYSWLTTFDKKAVPAVELELNIQDDKVEQINQAFKERFDLAYTKNVGKTVPLFLFDSYYHCLDSICTLITKDGPTSLGEHIQYEVYNIDIEYSKLLTNDELLEKLNIDKKIITVRLQDEIEKLGLIQCEDPFESQACIYDNDNLPENVTYNYPAEISDKSLLILNDKGKLELIFSIKNAEVLNITPYNGNVVSYLYPLQLVD